MICAKCKKVIPDGSVQCPECGADLKPSIKKEKKKKKNCLHKSLLQLLRGRGTGRAESFSENKSKI